MFVSAKVHLHVREELATERAKREVLSQTCASQNTTIEWLYVRVNQLEKERAILLHEVTQLPIPVPEIVANTVKTSVDRLKDRSELFAGTDDGSIRE